MPRGKFITVEGPDGAGKSTQLVHIEEWLINKDISVTTTREPGGTSAGEEIRELLLNSGELAISDNTELLLMFAARMQHLEEVILPALDNGKWVLCDRFTDATYAYQGGGRRIENQKIALLEKWVQKDIQPDLTLVFDVPVDIGLGRTGKRGDQADRFEKLDLEFKNRVRQVYLQRAETFPDRIKIVDSSQSIDQVTSQVVHILDQFHQQVRS